MNTALSSPQYVKFIRARDAALERFNANTQVRCSEVLTKALISIEHHAAWSWGRIEKEGFFNSQARAVSKNIERQISLDLAQTLPPLSLILLEQRRAVYLLSRLGEAEALARAKGKAIIGKDWIDKTTQVMTRRMRAGGSIMDRIEICMRKLGFKIYHAIERARVQELPLADMLKAINQAIPAVRTYKKPPNTLIDAKRALKEAAPSPFTRQGFAADLTPDGDETTRFTADFIDQDIWDSLTKLYKQDYVPKGRDNTTELEVPDADGESYSYYQWELEQETAQDFVDTVRSGQVDAANENGITDFVWIAVIDDKTDDCCAARDGLSTSEIESKLSSGEIDGGDCDAVVPPAHFNCRCTLAPADDSILSKDDDLSKEIAQTAGDFDAWLNS